MGPMLTGMYTLLWAICAPWLFLWGKWRGSVHHRLGRYPPWPRHQSKTFRLWMHGASAGDVLALVPTAQALRQAILHCEIVVTTMTGSGLAIAAQQGSLFDRHYLCPIDAPLCVGSALNRLKPDLLLLEYTELWPGLIHTAHSRRIPIVLQNGRFAATGLWRYRLLFLCAGNLLRKCSALLMRDAQQCGHAQALGADKHTVVATGNTKFDRLIRPPLGAPTPELARACQLQQGELLVACGSTHEGEEAQLFAIFKQVQLAVPQVKFLVAPRYIERAGHLAALGKSFGLDCLRRTKGGRLAQADVLLLDTLGELQAAYALCHIAFVGGSFVPRGGQNILEPAAAGKPVLYGPNVKNFLDAVALLEGRGGKQVHRFDELQQVLIELLTSAEKRQHMAILAKNQTNQAHGAAAANAQVLVTLLERRPSQFLQAT